VTIGSGSSRVEPGAARHRVSMQLIRGNGNDEDDGDDD
jgi:hypothetical protein